MRILYIIILCFVLTTLAVPRAEGRRNEPVNNTDSILAVYTQYLEDLVANQSIQGTKQSSSRLNPYLFRLFAPGTLYRSALQQSMSLANDDTDTSLPDTTLSQYANTLPSLGEDNDRQLVLNELLNEQLNKAYVLRPGLFATTQDDLMNTSKLRSDLSQKMEEEKKIAEKVIEEVPDVQIEAVEPDVKRPNFWTFKGNGGLQFTQNYFSRNWYQGGENNYSMLGLLTLDANFNNQRKVQLDNRLEAQLGFQTSESSDPKFRPTSNLLRITSKLGIKAIGKWNYSAQLQLQTQPYMSYQGSSDNVTGDFVSPLYVRSSIGMDFKLDKKNFNGTLLLAPLSYVITYVERKGLIQRYGINEGHHSKHEWGPNIEMKFTWKMAKNISWQSRLYWFSNFQMTRIENENTFNFSINKYLSAKLFMNPRYEDTKYYNLKRNEDGSLADESARETHWMFKEFLSFGLNYDF
ncbi:MAG: DUF3078 domain-containing protein [Bacteroidaceae bacterium]|nr:DUF3078 domain-containing protein [Bacteroidaceae bacterium]